MGYLSQDVDTRQTRMVWSDDWCVDVRPWSHMFTSSREEPEENGRRPQGGHGSGRTAGVSRREFVRGTGFAAVGAVMMPAVGRESWTGSGSAGAANEPVTVIVDAGAKGRAIPRDFAGLSFERGVLTSGNASVPGYLFSASNTALITLFRNANIKNVRIGGNTVDQQIPAGTDSDGYKGVDELFAFAAAAGANVIYSLRLNNPSADPVPNLLSDDASAAEYIWQHYRHLVNSYAIGNEPDWHSFHISDPAIYETTPGVPGTAYPSFLDDWRKFADAIVERVPGARFCGPDTGNYGTRSGVPYLTDTPDPATGVSWTQKFAQDEGGSGRIKDLTSHYYIGGSPLGTTAAQAIDNMLSAEWVDNTDIGTQPTGTGSGTTAYVPYPWFHAHYVAPVVQRGLPCRLTESNDYLTGIPGASDAFAAALWALDYMHWWAAHGASGVNFHNNQWIYTDTITPELGTYVPVPPPGTCSPPGCGNYRVSPKGYGIKAFDLGARGVAKPVSVSKSPDVNVTAYAVGHGRDLYVTIINKMHGAGARNVQVTIVPRDNHNQGTDAASITLAPGESGNPSSQTATLGGAAITNSAPWQGKWTPLSSGSSGVTVIVHATTATIVRIRR